LSDFGFASVRLHTRGQVISGVACVTNEAFITTTPSLP
jgi:hypothetical protein